MLLPQVIIDDKRKLRPLTKVSNFSILVFPILVQYQLPLYKRNVLLNGKAPLTQPFSGSYALHSVSIFVSAFKPKATLIESLVKPKESFPPNTMDTANPVNSSKLEASSCSRHAGWENVCESVMVDFGFTSDWLRMWREIFYPIGSFRNDKGDGNRNATNLHILWPKNSNFARSGRAFFICVHFFAVVSNNVK